MNKGESSVELEAQVDLTIKEENSCSKLCLVRPLVAVVAVESFKNIALKSMVSSVHVARSIVSSIMKKTFESKLELTRS